MSHLLKGRAWVFGDRIDTDLLAPGYAMKKGAAGLAEHCLEAINPDFAKQVRTGDILVAGDDFGIGSSREQAAISLKMLGISAILAKSFARIFYRNAINIGLPAFRFAEMERVANGDQLSFDIDSGLLKNESQNSEFHLSPMPDHLKSMIEAGGLMAQLEKTFGKTAEKTQRSTGASA